jgi:hypothetical protein
MSLYITSENLTVFEVIEQKRHYEYIFNLAYSVINHGMNIIEIKENKRSKIFIDFGLG